VKMLPPQQDAPGYRLRSVRGGVLLQPVDRGGDVTPAWRTVTRWKPSADELSTLRLAWQCVRYVPSNALVLAMPGATVGIAGGLPSQVDAVRLAIQKAGHRARGAVLASGSLFAYPDAVELANAAGVSSIVQPGGSVRDASVIEAADRAGIAMLFTGMQHLLP
jgi:phosphoribosylaminoimidazolecarboxamide formyltransferase/IMP cyclohydrolase